MARKIEVQIVGDASSLNRAFKQSEHSAKRFGASIASAAKTAAFVGVGVGLAALGALAVKTARDLGRIQKITAQTEAVIESTGGKAGVTAKQVDHMAFSIERLTGVEAETVQQGENLLLTFTNIRNGIGKGNDIFNQATTAITDMSVALGQDMKSSAIQVGKALNDPIKGITALRRVGVSFTKDQIKQVTSLVNTGKTLEAQKLILRELKTEFGGSAAAFGKTLPGQLAKLKHALGDVAEPIVQHVIPGLQAGITALTNFERKVADTKGGQAKVAVVFEGVQNIGERLFTAVAASLKRVDWPKAVESVQAGLLEGLNRIGEALGRVDFSKVGQTVGASVVRSLQGLKRFLDSVDWGFVGQSIVKGIGAFLRGVDWASVARGVYGFLRSALQAITDLVLGIGKELGKALIRGVIAGLSELGRQAEIFALKIVRRLLQALDVTVLGHSVVPGLGRVVDGINEKLKQLEDQAKATGGAIEDALEKPIDSVNRTAAVPVRKEKPEKPPVDTTAPPPAQAPPARKGITADQRNTFFDNSINRQIARASDVGTVAGQIKLLRSIAAQIGHRLEATKDVTRRLTLEDKQNEVIKQIAGLKDQQRQALLDALDFRLTKAQVTSTMKDDLAALNAISTELNKQIKAGHDVAANQQKLFDVTQQIKDARKAAASAVQFKALGLTATGDEKIPGVENLRKQLSTLETRIGDTNIGGKLKGQLAGVRKVLSGELGKATADVRAKIQDLFATIRGELDKGGKKPLTSTTSISSNKVLAGLGLDRDTQKQIAARLSSFNSAGRALAGTNTASTATAAASRKPTSVVKRPEPRDRPDLQQISRAKPAPKDKQAAIEGRARQARQDIDRQPKSTAAIIKLGDVIVNVTTTLDGRVLERNTTTHQQRRVARNSSPRRGR